MKSFLLAKVLLIVLCFTAEACFAQDPNLHIYLAFGQSNMAGVSEVTAKDRVPYNPRFLVLRAADHSMQMVGEFYPATPPMANSASMIGVSDFFGRAMVESLPDSIKVAVANVSIGGQSIDMFDKDRYEEYILKMESVGNTWWMPYLEEYGGNMYKRLVEMGEIAKRKGVIKGILFHQGEADAYVSDWPFRVKKVYNDLMTDLQLDPAKVPFLMGEFVTTEEGGDMGWRNQTVALVAKMIPNAHLISAKGCSAVKEEGGVLHFTREGYEILGRRYAETMLRLLRKSKAPHREISFRAPISMQLAERRFSVYGAPANARIRLFDVQGNLLCVMGPKGGMLPSLVNGRTLAVVESTTSKRMLTKFVFYAR